MNYIKLLNDFWRMRESQILKSQEADLYLYLLHRCNRGGWVNPFDLSTKEIERDLLMTRPTIVRSRATLQGCGLIKFREGKTRGKSPQYLLKKASKKQSECVNVVNTIEGECVKEIYTINDECVKECVNVVNTIEKKEKENFPPHPPYKEKEIKKEKDYKTLASLDTHDARERVKKLGLEENINSIDQLRIIFLARIAKETLMKQCHIPSAEEYKNICEEIIGEWSITKGLNFELTEDVRKHFINLVRIKSEKRRKEGGGRQSTQEREAERKRRKAEREAHDAECISFEEFMKLKKNEKNEQ